MKFILAGVFLIGLTIVSVYFPVASAGLFTLDDGPLLFIPQIRGSLESLHSLFIVGANVDYYPIRDFSYWLDWTFFGDNWAYWHIHQVALFIAINSLLFLTLTRLGFTRAIAFALTLAFTSHPIHVEMVAWLAARKDLLALIFGLLSTLAFVSGSKNKILLLCALVFYIFSLFSKASFISLPACGLIYLWLWKPKSKNQYQVVLAALVIAVMAGGFQSWFYSRVTDVTSHYPPAYRVQAALATIGKYFSGMAFPSRNFVDPDNWDNWADLNNRYVLMGSVLVLLFFSSFVQAVRNKNREGILMLAGFAALYLPTSGLLFPHSQFYSVRYLEPSLIWLFVTGAYLLRARIQSQQKIILVTSCMLALAWGTVSHFESKRWMDPNLVWEKSLIQTPESLSLKIYKFISLGNTLAISKNNLENFSRIEERNRLFEEVQNACKEKVKDSVSDSCPRFFWNQISEFPKRGEVSALTGQVSPQLDWNYFLPHFDDSMKMLLDLREGQATVQSFAPVFRPGRFYPTEQSRLYLWAGKCLTGEKEKAQGLILGFVADHLLSKERISAFLRGSVHPTHDLSACLIN
jgi:hypothetical protein